MRVLSVQRIVLAASLGAVGLWAPRNAVAADSQSSGSTYPGSSPSGNTAPMDSNATSPSATTPDAAGQTGTGMATDQASTMKPADQQLTQRVEAAIDKDKTLSTVADDVHVVARDGKVLLMGTVPSQAEKAKVEQYARQIAGKNNVKSQIEISSLQ